MKKLMLTQLMLLLFASVFFLSCGGDDDGPTILLPKLDGLFVFGENALAETPTEPNATMSAAKLDPTKGPDIKEGVYGKYMYIGANGKIQFAEVISEVGKIYGSSDASIVNGADEGFSVNDDVITGTLVEGAAAIAVADEGLYYVFADMNSKSFVITKVKGQMIGDALVPLGWDEGTLLPLKSTSKEKTVFEGTNIQMKTGGGYKYRFNDGWHSYTDAEISTFSFLGVVSYGDAWAAQLADVGFFTDNIPSFHAGYYTVNLTYTESTTGGQGEWKETLTKTGEVLVDYSNRDVGFFGNAFFVSEGVEGAWGDQGGVKKPTKAGNVYTWTWDNFQLIQDREFVIRQNGTWDGIQGVYNASTTRTGTAFDTQVTKAVEGANFFVKVGGVYDISFSIDASSGVQTLTIN